MSERPVPTSSLSFASSWFSEQAQADGTDCPCCGRFGKFYKTALGSSHVRALVEFYRHRRPFDRPDGGFRHFRDVLPEILRSSYGQLKHWALLEQAPSQGAGKSGLWRITVDGKGWLKGYRTVPAFAILYDDHVLRFEGPEVSVSDCLKKPFDLDELMAIQANPEISTTPSHAQMELGIQ